MSNQTQQSDPEPYDPWQEFRDWIDEWRVKPKKDDEDEMVLATPVYSRSRRCVVSLLLLE